MALLLHAPLEVLLQITSHLSTPEYGCLRRTCRQIEAVLFGAFAEEFFSKRQFALMECSIRVLVDIAKSRLGPCLTHLIIHLEHPDLLHFGDGGAHDVATGVRYNRMQAEYFNHDEFISTGHDVEMLSDALGHLPNLVTVGMRDFHSTTRRRDGGVWNSYGIPTLLASIQSRTMALPRRTPNPHMRQRGHEYTCHVFQTILRAMGHSAVAGGNTKLTRIEVLLHSCLLADSAFKIPNRFDAGISLALTKLTTIFLDHLSDERPWMWVHHKDDATRIVGEVGYFLSRFLTKVPALEHLRLNFQLCDMYRVEKLLSWLAGTGENPTVAMPKPEESFELANATDSLPALYPPAPKFSKLKAIDIGMAIVKVPTLLGLYQRYRSSLEEVGIHKTTLYSDTKTNTNMLARLCRDMAEADLQLRKLSLSHVRQASGIVTPRDFIFKESKCKHVKVWKGSTFAQSVKDITDELVFSSRRDKDDDGLLPFLDKLTSCAVFCHCERFAAC
ncbi:hypothetical protein F4678DRAFT_452145 [Xylaria arbuscula]|nr:hypothetical protein F4678DRAFT_452145 [Xylaria arbuscula]